jgi:hypothetical protein
MAIGRAGSRASTTTIGILVRSNAAAANSFWSASPALDATAGWSKCGFVKTGCTKASSSCGATQLHVGDIVPQDVCVGFRAAVMSDADRFSVAIITFYDHICLLRGLGS